MNIPKPVYTFLHSSKFTYGTSNNICYTTFVNAVFRQQNVYFHVQISDFGNMGINESNNIPMFWQLLTMFIVETFCNSSLFRSLTFELFTETPIPTVIVLYDCCRDRNMMFKS